jgi:chromosomal replication initiation ATPase DnaA
VALPDLASRLRATAAVEIAPADDTLLADLLGRLLVARHLAVPPGLRSWLLLRLPRTPAAIREAVARLDRASLAAGGAVTRPLAAAVLEEMIEPARCQ